MLVSIIICTRNRATHLKPTLDSLATVDVPAGFEAELIIVDTASTDGTSKIATSYKLPQMPIRFLRETVPGKSRGLNAAIAAAQGGIMLFTDDDVRFPKNWIAGMCDPIVAGKAHAVQGGILTAPHLLRSWLTPSFQYSLAHYEGPPGDERVKLVGANMAVSREVFSKVPAFDPEIGPGPGTGKEDTLFSWQLESAGYVIALAADIAVEHHFDESRLQRGKFLEAARKGGRDSAYLCYHWLHSEKKKPVWQVVRAAARLACWRIRRWREWLQKDGVASWEAQLTEDLSFHYHCWLERRRPRNYRKQGLVKIAGIGAATAAEQLAAETVCEELDSKEAKPACKAALFSL